MKENLEKLRDDIISDMAELYTRFAILVDAIEEHDQEIKKELEKRKEDEIK